jgi:hypothetical protein
MSSVKKVHNNFKCFRQKLRHIWEEYNLVEYYAPFLHEKIKSGEVEPFKFLPFLAEDTNLWETSTSKSISVLGQVRQNSLHNRVLLDSIGAFEDNLCKLVETVYLDYPSKLKSISGSIDSAQDFKLLNVILDSEDKEEIVSRIVEEKIRTIFYGNPLDFFTKDKTRLEFGDYFKADYKNILNEYAEITAARNIIVHNAGRIDRKYIREVKGTTYKLGNKLKIDTEYLKRILCVLEGLATMASVLVIRNIYKDVPRGKLSSSLKSFDTGIGKKM